MLVDKQSELMSDLLFTVHQHGGDDVTWKPPIHRFLSNHLKTAGWGIQIVATTFITVQSVIILIFLLLIGHFRVPNTLTFKMRLGAQPFLWKWVLFAWEWKMISISKAEHLPSFWNRGPGELGNGLITAAVDFGEKMRYFLLRHNFSEITT